MGRGAWKAIVHGVAESPAPLKQPNTQHSLPRVREVSGNWGLENEGLPCLKLSGKEPLVA